jgi:hypothetical protein
MKEDHKQQMEIVFFLKYYFNLSNEDIKNMSIEDQKWVIDRYIRRKDGRGI